MKRTHGTSGTPQTLCCHPLLRRRDWGDIHVPGNYQDYDVGTLMMYEGPVRGESHGFTGPHYWETPPVRERLHCHTQPRLNCALDCNTSLSVVLCYFQFCHCCCHTINSLPNTDTSMILWTNTTSSFQLVMMDSLSMLTYLLHTGKNLGLTMLSNLRNWSQNVKLRTLIQADLDFCPLVTRMDKMSDYL